MAPIRVTWGELKALKPCNLHTRRKLFTLKQRLLGRGITASEALALGVSIWEIVWVIQAMKLPFDVNKINYWDTFGIRKRLAEIAYWYPQETKDAIIAEFG